jgi:N-acetylglucosaminyl-diphospho-decaprenol L-rhamnosyltransferase
VTDGRIAVVVVNFGVHDLIDVHLADLDATSGGPPVVVVDNLSDGGERRAIGELCARRGWDLVAPPSNLGFGAGAAAGVGRARQLGAERFLLVHPDLAISRGDVAALDEVAQAHHGALVAPTIVRPDGTVWFRGASLDPHRGLTASRPATGSAEPWLSAACLLVDDRTWERLDGFDPRYFLYWEDVDLSRRHAADGGALVVAEDVTVVHEVGATQGSAGKSPLYCYFMCRNRLRYAALRLPRRDRLRWLLHAPRHATRVVLRSGRRSALRRPELTVAAVRGTLAGTADVLGSLARP